MTTLYIIIGGIEVLLIAYFAYHQWQLQKKARLLNEAFSNRDYSLRLSEKGLLPGERTLLGTLNGLVEHLSERQREDESQQWEQQTRLLTHEIMNGLTPIISISQALLTREDVKGSPSAEGILAIHNASSHLSELVTNYRKVSRFEKPVINIVSLRPFLEKTAQAYPQLTWTIDVRAETCILADEGMLRQVVTNLVKNAMDAKAQKIIIEEVGVSARETADGAMKPVEILIGNDGSPIPEEDRQVLFTPSFTTKHKGNGIGLSFSRHLTDLQGGTLKLADELPSGCSSAFSLTLLQRKR